MNLLDYYFSKDAKVTFYKRKLDYIGIKEGDKIILSKLCCEDYSDYNLGKLLIENYETYRKAKSIVRLGKITKLGEDFLECKFDSNAKTMEFKYSEKKKVVKKLININNLGYSDKLYLFEDNRWKIYYKDCLHPEKIKSQDLCISIKTYRFI